ncbi:uncharacterized protein TRIADDRAFT_60407 [Trichoplax adhaerens]|uniref:Uncharacterized protein n=1 Tax=Trichoplax adhaerens TaxID=10228 RepID=B3S850_TRIAD|nr:predicted protein [Trichoplax adhaerens]EDV21042.1 predicted protein [Trichoplax adhaerens]|eukprot:XP_002116372.1 predicted protein [Trichoplax adhaerens]
MAAATEYKVWKYPRCDKDNCSSQQHFGHLRITNLVHATHLKFAISICTANQDYYAFRMRGLNLANNRKQSHEIGACFGIRTAKMTSTNDGIYQTNPYMKESTYQRYSPAFNQTRYGGVQFIVHEELTKRLIQQCVKKSLFTARHKSKFSQRIKLSISGGSYHAYSSTNDDLAYSNWSDILCCDNQSGYWFWNYHKIPTWKGGKFPWEELEFTINGDDNARIMDNQCRNSSLPYCKIDIQNNHRYLYIRKDMIKIQVLDHPTSHSSRQYKSNRDDFCIPSMREQNDGYNFTCQFQEFKAKLNAMQVTNELYRSCDLFLNKDDFEISTREYIKDLD